ncbi:MAG: hypothetical protein SFU98_22090 [Leptospiraceae bacterium]|nr:hypothetical protein [Leptospiraceae bacterium]
MNQFFQLLTLLFVLFTFVNCPEKKPNNNQGRIAAYGLFAIQCPVTQAPAIGSSSRTAIFFSNGCTPFAMGFSGLSATNVTAENNIGATGTSTNSSIITNGDYKSGSEKKVNIEVTFQINADDGYIDVSGNATPSGTKPVGPTFRIKTTTMTAVNNSGVESAFTKGTVPQAGRNVQRVYCLEIHEESGAAHLFGWSKACNALSSTERGSYEFEIPSFSSTNPGSRVGFILNKSSLRNVIISGQIGTAGRLLSL